MGLFQTLTSTFSPRPPQAEVGEISAMALTPAWQAKEVILSQYKVNASQESQTCIGSKLMALCETLEHSFGTLGNLNSKRILDLGCGSKLVTNAAGNITEASGTECFYEPWMCRLLHHLGANVVGIDIRPQSPSEPFKSYQIDLTRNHPFESITEIAFDGIYMAGIIDNAFIRSCDSAGLNSTDFEARRILRIAELMLDRSDGRIIQSIYNRGFVERQ